ncbi:hypothetical protein OsJ_34845 [Oryza sativa Japonica Group]|uniref:Uncharacterized protein n=1 Tax=Oryza sativa subsp. japonica TaxID=39947 RepID=B9G8V8_ORYSJ|nr:hypothetical protein OsJ_34845 [Oryza sativa Japonica Group]
MALAFAVLATFAAAATPTTTTNLTLHNLCTHPVWPLVTANAGLPAIADAAGAATRLDGQRRRPRHPRVPAGGVVSVHGAGGLAEYSVSLVDGFNVAVVVTPHGFEQGRLCPSLGCAVDLAADCPGDGGRGGCMAAGQAEAFKARCPDTRTTPTDVEVTPQRCIQPAELKVVFCPPDNTSSTH